MSGEISIRKYIKGIHRGITTAHIRSMGNVTNIRLGNSPSESKSPLTYLLKRMHRFGYKSVDDPVTDDPDNILNVLIAQIHAVNDPAKQEALIAELRSSTLGLINTLVENQRSGWDFSWQVFLKLQNEFNLYSPDDLMLIARLLAIDTGYLMFLRHLVEDFGLDVNTLLRYAFNSAIFVFNPKKYYPIIRYLVSAGANPNVVDESGRTMFDLAADNPKILQALLGDESIMSSNARRVRGLIGNAKTVKQIVKNQTNRRAHALRLLRGGSRKRHRR